MFHYILIAICILIFTGACAYESRRLKKEARQVNNLLQDVNDPNLYRLCNRLYRFSR